ncbi:MAG TPA: IclR family transcriptional regulator [Syntrophorhabdaceae bacterium]|nr:IclR family transcriptional regulator [Syntrophorhabdaceae bacterium]
MNASKTEGFYNKSLERALQILLSFKNERRSATLTEIARVARIPKSTSLRLCATLVEYGFLRLDEQTKEYSPGLSLFELGELVLESFSVSKIASPYLDKLQESVRQTLFIDVLRDDYLVHVDKREDLSSPIRFGLQVGRRRPPHYGAAGCVLMAYLPDDEVERLLEEFPLPESTKKSITDKDLFKERLGTIRSRGYAMEDGEVVDMISGVSAPIHDHTGAVVAALAVAYVSHSLSTEEAMRVVRETVATAGVISRAMGCPAP